MLDPKETNGQQIRKSIQSFWYCNDTRLQVIDHTILHIRKEVQRFRLVLPNRLNFCYTCNFFVRWSPKEILGVIKKMGSSCMVSVVKLYYSPSFWKVEEPFKRSKRNLFLTIALGQADIFQCYKRMNQRIACATKIARFVGIFFRKSLHKFVESFSRIRCSTQAPPVLRTNSKQ